MTWPQIVIAAWLPLLIAILMFNSGAHAGERRRREEEQHRQKREAAWQRKHTND
ncbi:hypothetical protein [Zymobacter sp. IVIA_5232.4 C2]|uniref:hypothetical protein n=1 Tax=Zymobacter sp. IVIA_5232.4 C2 TaxID=3394855 RepID=UPI0039C0FE26